MKIKRGEQSDLSKTFHSFLGILPIIFGGCVALVIILSFIFSLDIPDTNEIALQAECQTVYTQLQGDLAKLDYDILMNRLSALDAELLKTNNTVCKLEMR